MIIENRRPTVSEYQTFRNTTYWQRVDEKTIDIALQNSLYSIVASEDNQVIGCGRIIGDGELYFYIQDLIVHPDFQNIGVGKKIMSELMNYIKKKAKP